MVYISIIEMVFNYMYEFKIKIKIIIFLFVVDIEEFEKYVFLIYNLFKIL